MLIGIWILSFVFSAPQVVARNCSDPPPPPVCYVDAEGGQVCYPVDEPPCIPDNPPLVEPTPEPACLTGVPCGAN